MILSVLCMAVQNEDHLENFLPILLEMANELVSSQLSEVIVVVGQGEHTERKLRLAASLGLQVIQSNESGYGSALKAGLAAARGQYVLTLDEDSNLDEALLKQLWLARQDAEIVVASRHLFSSDKAAPLSRFWFSRILNDLYQELLHLPVRDMTGSFRLYQTKIFRDMELQSENIGILPELLVRALANGWRIHEIPVHLPQRSDESSLARVLQFGASYFKTLFWLWRFRNSIDAADYDLRAFNSKIYFQRFWQRRRHKIITNWIRDETQILDIGCGSSQILLDLKSAIGLDIRQNKLRLMKNFGKTVVNGTLFTLPFPDQSFDCVICSEVIEHVRYDEQIYSEFNRVLRHGGTLILGTPDYGSIIWVAIEFLYKHIIPGGYADEHITHYTLKSLRSITQKFGFRVLESDLILSAEIILRCIKE